MPWPFSQKHGGEPKAEPGPGPGPLEPIRVFTRETEIPGFMAPRDERMTDVLQRGEAFGILPEGASPDPAHWLEILPAEILMVVPPPWVSPPERRLAHQPSKVFVRIGSYELTGTAHLMPGSERDMLARSSHPFLPLTDVALLRDDGTDPERLDVVIVNLRETSEYRIT